MEVVLIGSGNVAWNLGRLLKKCGHEVVQIFSRNAATASELAYELDTDSINYWSILNRSADIYIIAVRDDQLASVAAELRLDNQLVLHTSGAKPMDLLKDCSSRYGVLYPLQSLVRGSRILPPIPFLTEGNTPETAQAVYDFAGSLSSQVQAVTGDQRLHMHLAAVLVNNFTNHLYTKAQQWCTKHRLDFGQLLPLIEETGHRLHQATPGSLQTGPAIREDKTTLQAHLDLLQNDAALKELYEIMSQSIAGHHKN
jgi:predicted short-subunit dehydrogenase-like oxidoreductase (DUF2520 family)